MRCRNDSQVGFRRVSALLPEEKSEDRKAPESRNFSNPRSCRQARTGGAVFQAGLTRLSAIGELASEKRS